MIAAPLVPKLQRGRKPGSQRVSGHRAGRRVKIVAHRSEMGTGCRTGLPMIVADELEADWARVQVIQALGDPKYGSQDTDGSLLRARFLRYAAHAGATARTMLENAAATQMGRTRRNATARITSWYTPNPAASSLMANWCRWSPPPRRRKRAPSA